MSSDEEEQKVGGQEEDKGEESPGEVSLSTLTRLFFFRSSSRDLEKLTFLFFCRLVAWFDGLWGAGLSLLRSESVEEGGEESRRRVVSCTILLLKGGHVASLWYGREGRWIRVCSL